MVNGKKGLWTFWNILYDNVVRLELPEIVTALVVKADDAS